MMSNSRIASLSLLFFMIQKGALVSSFPSATLLKSRCFITSNKVSPSLCLYSTNKIEDLVENSDQKPRKKERLRFGGKHRYQSEELPLPVDTQSLYEFLSERKNQVVLLTGGKDGGNLEEININNFDSNAEILDVWNKNALSVGAEQPNLDEDKILKVMPTTICISLIEVCPESIIGSKVAPSRSEFRMTHPQVYMPEFQAVLIQSFPRAYGPKALVWLFNRIVYGGNPPDRSMNLYEKDSSRNEKAFLRVWAEPTINNTFVFTAESEIWLDFFFPRLLLRFFPMSKEKAEEICCDAMVKSLKSNLIPAVDMLTALYIEQMNVEKL